MPTETRDHKTLSIPVSGSLLAFVDERVKTGGYETVSEYVRSLIRADQKLAAKQRLEELLLEGMESGEPELVTEEFWNSLRRRAEQAGR